MASGLSSRWPPVAPFRLDAELLPRVARRIGLAVPERQGGPTGEPRLAHASTRGLRLAGSPPPPEAVLGTLRAVADAIGAATDRGELLAAVARALAGTIGFDELYFALADPAANTVTLAAGITTGARSPSLPAGTSLARSGGWLEATVVERRTMVRADLAVGRRTSEESCLLESGMRSYLAVPALARGTAIGAVVVVAGAQAAYRAFDADLLAQIGKQLGSAVANLLADEETARLGERQAEEGDGPREMGSGRWREGGLVGVSAALAVVRAQIEQVAPTDASVLVLGESGTGKELVARELHRRSRRRDGPMITVNCASIPRELFESEFFGHVKGAFTGAVRDRTGRFQLADGGTLLLDEVAELPGETQAKLLRVLQEGRFERVGEERSRAVDVRIIAATNRDLAREVDAGRFRTDLFYRLNVFPIQLPPLRERLEDIVPLAEAFLAAAARSPTTRAPDLDHEQRRQLQAYAWPGNVRELQNAIERALITARDGTLDFGFLVPAAPAPRPAAPPPSPPLSESALRRLERDNLLAALAASGGKVYGPGGAAALLGLPATTLASRLHRLGVRPASAARRLALDHESS